MAGIEVLDFGGGNRQCGIRGEGHGHHDKVYVGGVVVLFDGLAQLQRVLEVAGSEQGVVFRIQLLEINAVLHIVPVKLQVRVVLGLTGDVLHGLRREGTGFVGKGRVVCDKRGNILLAGQQGQVFGLTNGQAGGLRVLGEKVFLYQKLPSGVTHLHLLLLARNGIAVDDFMDTGVFFHIVLEILIGNGFAADFTHIVLGRHVLHGRHDFARIDDKEQQSDSDNNRGCYAKFGSDFFNYRHFVICF